MSDDPARLLANAIFGTVGRPCRVDLEEETGRRRRARPWFSRVASVAPPSASIAHPRSRRPACSRREDRARTSRPPASGNHERRAHDQEQEKSDVHQFRGAERDQPANGSTPRHRRCSPGSRDKLSRRRSRGRPPRPTMISRRSVTDVAAPRSCSIKRIARPSSSILRALRSEPRPRWERDPRRARP